MAELCEDCDLHTDCRCKWVATEVARVEQVACSSSTSSGSCLLGSSSSTLRIEVVLALDSRTAVTE